MHYSKTAFGNGKVTLARKGCPSCKLGQNNGFSPLNIKGLNDLYGCSKDNINTSTQRPKTCEKEDLNVKCPSWANQGLCTGTDEKPEQYMKENCFKSCYCDDYGLVEYKAMGSFDCPNFYYNLLGKVTWAPNIASCEM